MFRLYEEEKRLTVRPYADRLVITFVTLNLYNLSQGYQGANVVFIISMVGRGKSKDIFLCVFKKSLTLVLCMAPDNQVFDFRWYLNFKAMLQF